MKKTLLMAAVALAAGIITSQAQPVYSQNIVGYANVPTTGAGQNYCLSVPFKVGVSNGWNEVFGTAPEFSQLLLWNGLGYDAVQLDTGSATGWSDVLTGAVVPVGTLPVGQGFFFQPAAACTNTFAGTILVNVGTSNVMTLPTAGANYMVGCVVPYAGAVTNGNNSGGGPNINLSANFPEFSQLLLWNGLGYDAVQLDTGSATGWSDVLTGAAVPVPSISVAQGFFIQPAASNLKWTTGL